MSEIIHVICLGAEPVQHHTAGLARFGGREALLFEPPALSGVLEVRQEEILNYAGYGTPIRPVIAPPTYRGTLPIAITEIEGYVESGVCIGINGGAGPPGVVQSVIDSAFAALVKLHPNVSTSDEGAASAFRYYPSIIGDQTTIDVAPLFNVGNPLHMGIVLAMIEAEDAATAREIHETVSATTGPYAPSGYDNLRRRLNGVRRWMKYVPGFSEEKGDRYRYKF